MTAEMIDEAKERLILRRETHLDQLVDKLQRAAGAQRDRADSGRADGA